MARSGFFRITWSLLAVAAGVLAFAAGSAFAAPFTIGDVFAGVGRGHIKEYTPTGTLVQTLDTLSNSLEETGMCFDGNTLTSNLRSTNFSNNSMSRIPQTGPVQYPWGGGFNADPESCVVSVDPSTNQTVVYVGQADGTRDVLKFDLSGALLDSYDVATGPRGSDWIDLSADKCTLLYTSEGTLIRRYDVCADTQLADFATAPSGPCFALRIRVNGDVMVACSNFLYRFSPAGTLLQTYPKPVTETSFLFAMNLDPDGLSFWTAGFSTGHVYHYDITTGAIIGTFTAVLDGPTLAGLAIFGEPVVSLPSGPAKLTLSPKTATNPVGTQHCVTATVTNAAGGPVANITVRFSVTGSVTTSGSETTNADGEAEFCYTGPAFPGADEIHAYADTDNDSMEDADEPFDDAEKTWVLPVSTPGCEVKITNGGWIIAKNGDQSSFGGNAEVDAVGNVSGNEEYQDHGPANPMNLKGNVLVVVCTSTTQATIYGEATIDGGDSFLYRLNVEDNAEPGKGADKYWILVANGYDSGNQILKGGNVQIHKS
ncbi:MAG: hypothetical protein V7645_13 [Actinomycetota bacterium]